MYDYEEACPVSKASSVLCERWTLQILREMLLGATRFSELQKLLPRLSPTLLNTRLRNLEDLGLVVKCRIPEKRGHEYQLTPSGRAVMPIVQEMGRWGMRWQFECMDETQLNVSTIVRDFAVALRADQLPSGDLTLQFNVEIDGEISRKFVMRRGDATQVCDDNLGNEVDLFLNASLGTLGQLWYGDISVEQARSQGLLKVAGRPDLDRTLARWLGNSQFAPFNPRAGCRIGE